MNKKLLLVGYFPQNPTIYAYAQSFIEPLQKIGFNVNVFNYRKKIYPLTQSKISSYLNTRAINNALIKQVTAQKPDIIFFIKAETISAATIRHIKKVYNPYLINFYPDSPFALWNGNSNKEVLLSLPVIDCFLIWSEELIPALRSAGAQKSIFFPFAFDESLFSPTLTLTEQEKAFYTSDVSFIGTWEPEREWWLTQLCTGLPTLNVAIWGNEWGKNIAQNSPLKNKIRDNAIYGITMRKVFMTSKIVLNFIRRQNLQAHNMRTFEVPASNAFLLTQRTDDQAEKLFTEDENITCFENVSELIDKVNFYLQHRQERERIRQNGFIRAQEFTLIKQLEKLFSSIKV